MLAPVATARVLVAARDDDVRYLLQRRCQLSDHLQVVAETKEPISSLRAAARLRPDLIVVQVQSASDTEVELITAFKELSPHVEGLRLLHPPGWRRRLRGDGGRRRPLRHGRHPPDRPDRRRSRTWSAQSRPRARRDGGRTTAVGSSKPRTSSLSRARGRG